MIINIVRLLYALIVLSLWSQSDVKTGKVHNVGLVLPVFFSALFDPMLFVATFVPVFVVLASVYMAIRKRGLFGFADVIAIPFVLMHLIYLNIFGIMSFVGMFAYLMMYANRVKYDKKLKRKIYNRIILMPILLLSYFVGVLIHLVFFLLI